VILFCFCHGKDEPELPSELMFVWPIVGAAGAKPLWTPGRCYTRLPLIFGQGVEHILIALYWLAEGACHLTACSQTVPLHTDAPVCLRVNDHKKFSGSKLAKLRQLTTLVRKQS
jgi:hypothetical protein